MAQIAIVEDTGEGGYGDAGVVGTDAHGEFIAEEIRGAQAHAGNAHVFAQRGDQFHVELVKSDDAVEVMLAGEPGDRANDLLGGHDAGHGEEIREDVARPIGVGEALNGE